MNRLSYILLVLIVVGVYSCTENEAKQKITHTLKEDIPKFHFVIDTIDAPDSVQAIYFFNETILLQTPDKIWCWDMNLFLDSIKTQHINKRKFKYIEEYNDSLIATEINQHTPYFYYLDSSFVWKKMRTPSPNSQKLMSYEPLMVKDSTYSIFACCFGEFGGMLYFQNNLTGTKTGSLMTCATQILQLDNTYFVVEFLRHMGTNSKLHRIKDPEALTSFHSDTIICSYWMETSLSNSQFDSLFLALSKGTETLFYGDSDSLLTLTFIYKSQLLSFIDDDKSAKMYLSRYQDDKLVIIDTMQSRLFSENVQNIYNKGNELWFDNSTYRTKSIAHFSNDTFRIYYFK